MRQDAGQLGFIVGRLNKSRVYEHGTAGKSECIDGGILNYLDTIGITIRFRQRPQSRGKFPNIILQPTIVNNRHFLLNLSGCFFPYFYILLLGKQVKARLEFPLPVLRYGTDGNGKQHYCAYECSFHCLNPPN